MASLNGNKIGVVIVIFALVGSIGSGYLLNAEDVLDCTTDWQYHTDVAGAFYGTNADMHVPYEPRQNLTGYSVYDPEVTPYTDTTVHGIEYTIAEAQNGYWLPERSMDDSTLEIYMHQTKALYDRDSDPTGATLIWSKNSGSAQTKTSALGYGMGTDWLMPSGFHSVLMQSYAELINEYNPEYPACNFTPLTDLVYADPLTTGNVSGTATVTGDAYFVVLNSAEPEIIYPDESRPFVGFSAGYGYKFTLTANAKQLSYDYASGVARMDGVSYPIGKVYYMWSHTTESAKVTVRSVETAYVTYIDPIGGVTPIPVDKTSTLYEWKEIGSYNVTATTEMMITRADNSGTDTDTYSWSYSQWYTLTFIDTNYNVCVEKLHITSIVELQRYNQSIVTDATYYWGDGTSSNILHFETDEDDGDAPRWGIPKFTLNYVNNGAQVRLVLTVNHPLFVQGHDPRASNDASLEDDADGQEEEPEEYEPVYIDPSELDHRDIAGSFIAKYDSLTRAPLTSKQETRTVTIFSDSTNNAWYRQGLHILEASGNLYGRDMSANCNESGVVSYTATGDFGMGTGTDSQYFYNPDYDLPRSWNMPQSKSNHQIEVATPGGATTHFEDVYWTNTNINSHLSMVIPRPASDMDRTMELRFSDGSTTELGIKYTSADGWQITTETFYTTPYYPFYGINHVVTNIGDWPAISLDMDFTNVATPWLTVTPIESFTNYLSYTELTNKSVQPYTDFKVQHAGLTSIHFPATVSWFNHEIIDTVVFLDSGGLYIQDGIFNLNTSFPNDIIVRLDIRSSAHTGDGASIRINGTEVAHWDVARDKDGEIKDNVWLIDGKEYDFAHVHLFYVDQSCDSIIIDGRTFDGGIYIDGKFYEKGHLYAQYGKNANFTDLGVSDRNWDVVMEGTWAFATAYSTGENAGEIVTQWAESGWDWDMNYFALVFIGLCIVGLLIARWKFEMTMGDWLTVIAGIMIVYTLIRVI